MAHLSFILIFFLIYYSYCQQCDQSSDIARFDCYPENDATQEKCLARNCCWRQPFENRNQREKHFSAFHDINVPYCYYPKDFPTYKLQTNEQTEFGQRLRINKSETTYMPHDITDLTVDLIYETEHRFRIRIYDTIYKRYEVPLEVPVITKKTNQTDYDVKINSNPFSLLITRKSTGVTLFDSSVSPLIFADQFIKFSTRLSSPYVYGLGEHRQALLIDLTEKWKKLTFWSRDFPPVENTNLYGVHPFHINPEFNRDNSTNFHGQFFLNSNAMDIDLQPLPALTYTTIGGIIDLYIFTGPTIQNVIEQYWDIIGKPIMPPFWSLGFHLCRYGYNSIENMLATVKRMDDANFPYDVQWTDIDAMSSYLDFTYDEKNFHGLPDFVRNLQANGKHYVNIIDPGISSVQSPGSYLPYEEGLRKNIFMKKFNSTELILGKVWPGITAFPDFTNPNATDWWTNISSIFHDIVPFDGMWIDMNEPSSFIDGSSDGCTMNNLDNPPFTPNVLGGSLSSKTLCPSTQQYLSQHYNLHSMFGYFEAKVSNAALKTIRKKRPFVLSRSSFAGSGKFTAHWTGDNRATFDDMYFSIPAILNFNMFGITHVGADICGFGLETTEELCTRWMQLGAFYPFMRNHNDLGQKDQDPGSFSYAAQQSMKQALLMRYSLVPFWYTRHYEAAMLSRTIIQPLFFEYPNDRNTYTIDQQFLIGRALLVSPNLKTETTSINAYIPSDVWYEFPSGIKVEKVGTFINLNAPLSKINVHVRGGFIIPMQIPGDNLIIGRGNPFTLLVVQSQWGNANGNLFWDDGDSIGILIILLFDNNIKQSLSSKFSDSIETKTYNYLEFSLMNGTTLRIDALVTNYQDRPMRLELVKILGVNKTVTNVNINGKSYTNFLYNIFDQILLIYGLELDMLTQSIQTIQWTMTN
ncbi:unnamed protein product [Adineta steineri]|uniref:P-type domain-containing protein n=1 Tax=Adineta steineri TaxID=433720 RepID=A0A819BMJ3_9BILA|nr:unnamed protein product [Adineta steineri]CAF3800642.1 unnamed protein product [Adineta steineri]